MFLFPLFDFWIHLWPSLYFRFVIWVQPLLLRFCFSFGFFFLSFLFDWLLVCQINILDCTLCAWQSLYLATKCIFNYGQFGLQNLQNLTEVNKTLDHDPNLKYLCFITSLRIRYGMVHRHKHSPSHIWLCNLHTFGVWAETGASAGSPDRRGEYAGFTKDTAGQQIPEPGASFLGGRLQVATRLSHLLRDRKACEDLMQHNALTRAQGCVGVCQSDRVPAVKLYDVERMRHYALA